MKLDAVYALAVRPENPIYFYVGIAVNPAARFKKHQKDIESSTISSKRNATGVKKAYEWLRHSPLGASLFLEVLDAEAAQTEEWWRSQLILAGHPIQNENKGNKVKRTFTTKDLPKISGNEGLRSGKVWGGTFVMNGCDLTHEEMLHANEMSRAAYATNLDAWAATYAAKNPIKAERGPSYAAQILKEIQS